MITRVVAALAMVGAVLAGCAAPDAGAGPAGSTTAPAPTTAPATGTAALIRVELSKARVIAAKPEVPGYSRAQFGKTWTDDHAGRGGHNGCDTRDDVLATQLTGVEYRPRSKCVIVAGVLADPYTGKRIEFRKTAATAVQIDHMYPLSRAWDMGASRWTLQRRTDFANDQAANLLAVDGKANSSKGDSGPGEWLPINRAYRCTYVLRYLQVARKYRLPITADDRDAAGTITRSCP